MKNFTDAQFRLSQKLRDELLFHRGVTPDEVQEVLRSLAEDQARLAKRYAAELECGF